MSTAASRVATLGPIGRVPVLGGFLATTAGLASAVAIQATSGAPQILYACWAVLLLLTMIVVPRALADGTIPRQIVLDRFAGIWLAAAPLLPLAAAAQLQSNVAALLVPLLIYHALLAGPLRRMGRRPRPLLLLSDDLIAGALTLVLSIGLMSALIATAGAPR